MVANVVVNATQENSRVGPGVLRMFFHDCFVEGCNGSILIDPASNGGDAERNATANQSLQQAAFDLIDKAKAAMENICPETISCADVLAFAAATTLAVICVQTFTKLISGWCGGNVEEEKVPGFHHFVMDRYTSDCCICSVLPTNFDLRDANTFSLLGEIVASLKVIYKKCGNEFLAHLATKLLPGVHCPPNLAEQYCLHIQRSDSKEIRAFYKSFIEKLRLQQNGSMGYR